MSKGNRLANTIASRLGRMSRPSAVEHAKDYYVFKLTGTIDGRVEVGVQTMWIGYEGANKTREIRQASVMNADWWLKTWAVLDEPFLVVNEPIEVALLLREGGNALVAVEAAQKMLPSFLKPQVWDLSGEERVREPKRDETYQKAPTKKIRAAVLKRDNYRCRICGQRPADDVNVQLDVHHIIPWEDGGLTERANLMTLCLACHKGLHPHFEPKLFELLPDEDPPNQSALKRSPKVERILYSYSWSKSFESDERR